MSYSNKLILRKDGQPDQRFRSNWRQLPYHFVCSLCGTSSVSPSLPRQPCKNCNQMGKPYLSYSINATFEKQQSKRKRWELWKKQEERCVGCGFFVPFHMVTVDHIVPRNDAVREDQRNRQLLCSHCNSRKGDLDMIELARRNNEMIGCAFYEAPLSNEFCVRIQARERGLFNWFHAIEVGMLGENLVNKKNENACRAWQNLWFAYEYGARIYGNNTAIGQKMDKIEGLLLRHNYNANWVETNTTGCSVLYNPLSSLASEFRCMRMFTEWKEHGKICRGSIDLSDEQGELIVARLGNSGYGIPILRHSNGSYIQAWCCEIKADDIIPAPNDIEYRMTFSGGKWRGVATSKGWLR